MTNPYELLMLDIDGTILDGNRNISAADREAISKVRDLGIKISLSTGRVVEGSLDIISDLSLDNYHIFFDGALVSNPNSGKEIFAKPIDKEIVGRAVNFAHENEIALNLYSSKNYFIEKEDWASNLRKEFYHTKPILSDFNQLWREERIIKGALTLRSPEDRAKAELLYREFSDVLNISYTKTPAFTDIDFINILAPGVSKGNSLERLAEYLGIPLAKTIAVGDGPNDVSLLAVAGLAIAMGNAPDNLRDVADFVTLDVNHSGLSKAISKFINYP
ncbi:Cof-type HAD-IIB family hydrolase [Chloroflexota bacterium]